MVKVLVVIAGPGAGECGRKMSKAECEKSFGISGCSLSIY